MSVDHGIAVVDRRPLILECVTRMFSDLVNRDPPSGVLYTILPFLTCGELGKALATSAAIQNTIDLAVLSICSASSVQSEIEDMMTQLKEYLGHIPVIILSECEDKKEIFDAFRRGVRGYVHAAMTAAQVMDALKLVLKGGTYLPDCILSYAAAGCEGKLLTNSLGQVATDLFHVSALSRLTPRQQDVLTLLRKGLSNRLIAQELHMCEGTVKVHVAHIMRKLRAQNRTHAAFLADQIALLDEMRRGAM